MGAPTKLDDHQSNDPYNLIESLEQYSAAYRNANNLTASHPDYVAPADIIETALRSIENPPRAEFLNALQAQDAPSVFTRIVAASLALEAKDYPLAEKLSLRAMASAANDLHLQSMVLKARARGGEVPSLVGKFCPAPFENLETAPGNNAYFCCPAWLPAPIGNLEKSGIDQIWNSTAARDIRASIHDGSFRYCSRFHCARITQGNLVDKSKMEPGEQRRIAVARRPVTKRKPRAVILSHDYSCNLSCPSCRKELILAKKDQQSALNKLADRVIFPMLADAQRLRVTGSGDPFGSAHFQYVLRNLGKANNSELRIDLQTNGVLLTPKLWKTLHLEGRVGTVMISMDAAKKQTYDIVRRGGDFERLLENLEFLGELRREKRIERLRLDFVVQRLNYREMPEFVSLLDRFSADGAKFQMIRSWGTYSPVEFAQHNIGDPANPEYAAFQAVLKMPVLQRPDLQFWGMPGVSNSAASDVE